MQNSEQEKKQFKTNYAKNSEQVKDRSKTNYVKNGVKTGAIGNGDKYKVRK